MRVLIVENFDGTGHGQVGAALNDAGAAVDRVRAHHGEPLPSGDGHDGLVVLGGGQNALDDAGSPHFPALLSLMRDFSASGRAVLGICLGAQLLARAHGAVNILGAAPEFGWREVGLTEAGRADPVLDALPARFPIFQWHDDTFTLPEDAVHLATNEIAANQAFRIGRASYGIQFHFEADRPLVSEWNATYADYLARRHPEWAAIHAEEAERHGPAADAAGRQIAEAWVRLV